MHFFRREETFYVECMSILLSGESVPIIWLPPFFSVILFKAEVMTDEKENECLLHNYPRAWYVIGIYSLTYHFGKLIMHLVSGSCLFKAGFARTTAGNLLRTPIFLHFGKSVVLTGFFSLELTHLVLFLYQDSPLETWKWNQITTTCYLISSQTKRIRLLQMITEFFSISYVILLAGYLSKWLTC